MKPCQSLKKAYDKMCNIGIGNLIEVLYVSHYRIVKTGVFAFAHRQMEKLGLLCCLEYDFNLNGRVTSEVRMSCASQLHSLHSPTLAPRNSRDSCQEGQQNIAVGSIVASEIQKLTCWANYQSVTSLLVA